MKKTLIATLTLILGLVKTLSAAEPASDLNFNQTPVDLVFETYAKMTGKTVIKDPQTPTANISLKSAPGQKLTKEEQLEAIEVTLEMNGIHLEPYGEKFVRALPRNKVRNEGIPFVADPEGELKESGKVVSIVIRFKNIATDEAQKALEGFKSASGILLVFERTNSILVTDTEMNIKRMLEVAKMIDISTPVLENVYVRQIKYASAQEIKTVLEQIVQESQKEQEKDGKAVNNAARNNAAAARPLLGGLRRPGQPAAPEPPKNMESVVTSVSDADRGMIRGKVMIVADERSNKLIIVTMKSNMDFFDKVIEQFDVETTPDTVVKVYRLKYAEAEEVSDMINDLIGNSSSSKNSKANQNPSAKSGTSGNLTRGQPATAAKQSANQRTGEAKAGELTKDNTTVLSDKRINGLVVMTQKELVPVLESIIESMDVKLSQVLIETVIIEVTLGDDLKTGIDWVQNGRMRTSGSQQVKNNLGQNMFYRQRNYTSADGDTSWSQVFSDSVPEGYSFLGTDADGNKYQDSASAFGVFQNVVGKVKDSLWTGSSGYAQVMGGGAMGGSGAASIAMDTATNLLGSAFNYIFKSDKLNLSAIINATKTDSRAKYLASPIIMTVDNKEATIDATESRKFFSGYETSYNSVGNDHITPKYDSKDIGIKIKVTPKINPNGTVMLKIEEEYSQLGAGQSILVGAGSQKEIIDTALTRKMSADALLENRQTVILTGLTETYKSEQETGIPILKDIPWIGKWLFGSVSQTESRKELLIFMTPYVLDDGEVAQAEAIRRKKSLSDPNAWDDHGWSTSVLADPVSKKEQLRRLRDEWAKQDEERKTKIAIEKAKVDRMKKLQELTEEERKVWLKMHQEELDKEARKELEKKMLDEDSQEELKKLAAAIRAKKLAEAEAELKEMERLTAAENERSRLDREQGKVEKVGGGEGGGGGGGEGVGEGGEKGAAAGPQEAQAGNVLNALVDETR